MMPGHGQIRRAAVSWRLETADVHNTRSTRDLPTYSPAPASSGSSNGYYRRHSSQAGKLFGSRVESHTASMEPNTIPVLRLLVRLAAIILVVKNGRMAKNE